MPATTPPTIGVRKEISSSSVIPRVVEPGGDDLVDRADDFRRQQVGAAAPDLLTDLLLAQEQSAEFTDARLTDELLTLLLAGHETTAMVLTWTWLPLATAPEVVAGLHAEIDAAPSDADPSRDLPYTRAVIAEAMRLRPAVWAIERMPREVITLDGRHVPRAVHCG